MPALTFNVAVGSFKPVTALYWLISFYIHREIIIGFPTTRGWCLASQGRCLASFKERAVSCVSKVGAQRTWVDAWRASGPLRCCSLLMNLPAIRSLHQCHLLTTLCSYSLNSFTHLHNLSSPGLCTCLVSILPPPPLPPHTQNDSSKRAMISPVLFPAESSAWKCLAHNRFPMNSHWMNKHG